MPIQEMSLSVTFGLSASLSASLITFIVGVESTLTQAICKAVALLLHFFNPVNNWLVGCPSHSHPFKTCSYLWKVCPVSLNCFCFSCGKLEQLMPSIITMLSSLFQLLGVFIYQLYSKAYKIKGGIPKAVHSVRNSFTVVSFLCQV